MNTKINDFLREIWGKFATYEEVAKAASKHFKKKISTESVRKRGVYSLGLPKKSNEPPQLTPEEELNLDTERRKEKVAKRTLQQKYDTAIKAIDDLKAEKEIYLALKEKPKTFPITRVKGSGGEATAITLASDWHIEEEVNPESCGGLNFYNLEESKRRAEMFFATLLYLIQLEQKNTVINRLVLGLLGDFITSDIHPDTGKSCLLETSHAIVRCRDYIISGIEYLLKNSDLNIEIFAHSGNHGRKDKEQMITNEAGNSVEYLMYHMLKLNFRNEPRVVIHIAEGYHSYLPLYEQEQGKTILRFHHGHHISYGGGVGGITIPVAKKISKWNQSRDAREAPFYEMIKGSINEWNLARPADIDCFGHFHQFLDGGNFIANGSMIGYNAYAVKIGAGYEPPKQALFYVHSKLGHYDTRRILFPKT